MQGLNRCTLIGNLGNDAELSYTQAGTALLKLRVAVNERVKRRDEWQDHVEWFTVIVWGKRAEALSKLLSKGAAVMAEGPMRQRSFEGKDGSTRYSFEVNADNVLLLGGRGGARQQERESEPPPPSGVGDDDDIPF